MKLHKYVLAAAVAVTGLFTVQPANAAPTATCALSVPSRIYVNATYNLFQARLAAGCPSTTYTAVWKSSPVATNDGGRLAFTGGDRVTQFGFYGSMPPLGTITWTPVGVASDSNGTKVADLAAASTISRCSTVAALDGGRKGTRTALLTTVSYWRPASDRYVRWANKQVLIQYQDIGTTTWKGLAYVTTNSVGQVTYNYYPNRTRRYRVYVPGNSSIWNTFSPIISR